MNEAWNSPRWDSGGSAQPTLYQHGIVCIYIYIYISRHICLNHIFCIYIVDYSYIYINQCTPATSKWHSWSSIQRPFTGLFVTSHETVTNSHFEETGHVSNIKATKIDGFKFHPSTEILWDPVEILSPSESLRSVPLEHFWLTVRHQINTARLNLLTWFLDVSYHA